MSAHCSNTRTDFCRFYLWEFGLKNNLRIKNEPNRRGKLDSTPLMYPVGSSGGIKTPTQLHQGKQEQSRMCETMKQTQMFLFDEALYYWSLFKAAGGARAAAAGHCISISVWGPLEVTDALTFHLCEDMQQCSAASGCRWSFSPPVCSSRVESVCQSTCCSDTLNCNLCVYRSPGSLSFPSSHFLSLLPSFLPPSFSCHIPPPFLIPSSPQRTQRIRARLPPSEAATGGAVSYVH